VSDVMGTNTEKVAEHTPGTVPNTHEGAILGRTKNAPSARSEENLHKYHSYAVSLCSNSSPRYGFGELL